MNPYVLVLSSRLAFQFVTETLRIRMTTASENRANTVSARPTSQFSRNSSARTATSMMTLPRMRTANVEKNPPSVCASPSMRSIISPGVLLL